MVFSHSITTTASTAKKDATKTVVKVAKGLVYKFEVEFPPGCCGLMHVQIFDGSYQVYPASANDSYHSDARVISFEDSYLKTAAPFEFVVKTWNLDETYEHTIQVMVGLVSSEIFMSRYMPGIAWKNFQTLIAKAGIEQEVMKQRAIAEFQETFKAQ